MTIEIVRTIYLGIGCVLLAVVTLVALGRPNRRARRREERRRVARDRVIARIRDHADGKDAA